MKRVLTAVLMLGMGSFAIAQEKEVTNVTTETTTVSNGSDLLNNWNVDDASTLPPAHVHLRLRYNWVTSSQPANNGDSNDDHAITPSLIWGIDEFWQLNVTVPYWISEDGQDRPGELDGNYDTYMGLQWRFLEQDGNMPAMAYTSTLRIPTGDESNKVDYEGRLILTNQYESGIRSNLNAFVASVNGDNNDENARDGGWGGWGGFGFGSGWQGHGNQDRGARHFQWGFVVGLDGPLCSDGAVRWVVDYMHRSSYNYGRGNLNVVELGFEWGIDDQNALSMSVQVGLDGEDEAINTGIGLAYSHSLGMGS